MTLQQLTYIVAVDQTRHFELAAEKCFVTQATLSMMIKKLEDELGVKIFDRSKHPVIPTQIGVEIIHRAHAILNESDQLLKFVDHEQHTVSGELKIGIIPTLAPYLLPLFLKSYLSKYPQVKLQIVEITTDEITQRLLQQDLDVGILATPLNNSSLIEQPLFYEEFVVYTSVHEKMKRKKFLLAKDIDVNKLLLLQEGHCLRAQVVNLCELKSREKEMHQLDFSAGSIETLKKVIETNGGITILPALAIKDLTKRQLQHIYHFKPPAPVREIGFVTYRHYIKEKLVTSLKQEIIAGVPKHMLTQEKYDVINL